jgi:hypothetical protein
MHVWELNKRLILLAMNDVLVAMNNVESLLHHIHSLICATTHSKYTSECLQEPGVRVGGGGGTLAVGSARRCHIRRR